MKTTLILLLAVSSLAFAKAKPKVEYKTQFENPIQDERIEFTGCAIEGALYGIATGNYGDVLCWGKLKDDGQKEVYAYLKEGIKTVQYFEVINEKNLGGFDVDGYAGVNASSVTLRTLSKDLQKKQPSKQSTLKFRSEFMYSEGNTMLRGKLPGSNVKIEAPVFYLPHLSEEIEDFIREIQ